MKPSLLKRLEALEQARDHAKPVVLLRAFINPDRSYVECQAFKCHEGEWQRLPDENMQDFIKRVHDEAAEISRSLRKPLRILPEVAPNH